MHRDVNKRTTNKPRLFAHAVNFALSLSLSLSLSMLRYRAYRVHKLHRVSITVPRGLSPPLEIKIRD